jgi:hypothetical protein
LHVGFGARDGVVGVPMFDDVSRIGRAAGL